MNGKLVQGDVSSLCSFEPHKGCLGVPLGSNSSRAVSGSHSISSPGSLAQAIPGSDLAAGDPQGEGAKEKESHPTAAYLSPGRLGILLCLSSEDYGLRMCHLTLTASCKCF